MAKQYFKNIQISDEEWNGVKVASASVRPNAKSAYGSGLNAEDTKAIFDKGPELIKERLNKLVDDTAAVEDDRTAAEKARVEAEKSRETAETQRKYIAYAMTVDEDERKANEKERKASEEERKEAEKQRKTTFEAAQIRREREFQAAQEERAERFEEFFDDLGIAQGPGESESKVMSQRAVTKYVPKIKSKNLLDVTWKNAKINSNGSFTPLNSGKKEAAFAEYIPIQSNSPYTISWGETNGLNIYVHQYNSNKEFIDSKMLQGRYPNCSTIITDENCYYIRIYLWAWASLPWESVIPPEFQMEQGTVATHYVESSVINNDATNGLTDISRIISNGYKQQLPLDSWMQGYYINPSTGAQVSSQSLYRAITKEYIQMRKGDKIYFDGWDPSNVVGQIFEYNIYDKTLLTRSPQVNEYTVQNDCFVRVDISWFNPATFEEAISGVTFINNHGGIQFEALPIDKIINLIKIVINKS